MEVDTKWHCLGNDASVVLSGFHTDTQQLEPKKSSMVLGACARVRAYLVTRVWRADSNAPLGVLTRTKSALFYENSQELESRRRRHPSKNMRNELAIDVILFSDLDYYFPLVTQSDIMLGIK